MLEMPDINLVAVKEIHYFAQLGLSKKYCAIKVLVVCWTVWPRNHLHKISFKYKFDDFIYGFAAAT